jgi:putative CocE/NonD family hydrolase
MSAKTARMMLLVLALAACDLAAADTDLEFRAPLSATDASTPAAMRDLAERLLPVYQESDPDRYLANLSALQMVAGDYAPADGSRQSLRDRRRRADSGRPAGRSAIFDIYAHARAIEQETHIAFADSFAKAYRESIARLSDRDAYAVERWLESPPESLEENLQGLLEERRGNDVINQTDAVKLIWAYLAFDASRAFAPLVPALDAEDDARRYVSDEEVLIDTPGGAPILASVVRPKGMTTPAPALLELGIEVSQGSAKECAAHGYAGVSAHFAIGRAGAHTVAPYQHDADAAHAVIEWISRQPWSDGRVAMYGEGYAGFTPWAAATRLPAALKAIATAAPTAPGVDVPMSGNIFQNSAYRWSLKMTNTKPSLEANFDDDAAWRALNEKWYRSGARYRDLGRLYGQPDPIFIRWLNHPSYDRFWQSMIPYAQQFAGINIPVLTISGYFAASAPGALHYFAEHHRYDSHADHTLLIGPYDDEVMRNGPSPQLHGYEIDPAARVNLRELRYQWFDHVLKNEPLPSLLSDRINYEVMGANVWAHASSLDQMAEGTQKYYLDPAVSGEGHRLSRRKSSKLAIVRQTVGFKDRSDAGWLPPSDLISKSLVTHNAVMYVSDPLTRSVALSGLLAGRLDFTVNKMDMDVNIVLYELLAGGDYLRLFDPAYELRLSYAQDRVHRHLLKAGERQQVSFKSERLTSRQLGKGSRLVMVLRTAKRPDREINYGTGNDVSEESIADGKVPLKIRWYNDSYIEIPVRAAPGAK